MTPTKRFWFLIAVGIPIAGIAAAAGAPLLGVAYDAFLLLLLFGTYALAPKLSALKIRREFDKVLSVRAENKVVLVIENTGVEHIAGELRDEPPPQFSASQRQFKINLAPGQREELTYTLTPFERGDDAFRATYVRVRCPLGLVDRQVELPTEEPVRVYPNLLALRKFDLLNQQGRMRELGLRRSRARGLGTEFESLREYTTGDDYRKIDWKASARRDKTIVRQYEQERNQSVLIVVDVGRHMLGEVQGVRKLDHVLDAILMLSQAASVAGDQVGLLVYSDTVRRFLPPRKGRSQLGMVIEAIHDLVADPIESDDISAFGYLQTRWKRRSLMVIFTDYDEPQRARELVTSLGPMARKHLTLLCRIQDPKLDELVKAVPNSRESLFQLAAASLLLEERVEAQKGIASAGVETLNSEPQDLASRLVKYYFRAKERNLI